MKNILKFLYFFCICAVLSGCDEDYTVKSDTISKHEEPCYTIEEVELNGHLYVVSYMVCNSHLAISTLHSPNCKCLTTIINKL